MKIVKGYLSCALMCASIVTANAASAAEISITSPAKDASVICGKTNENGYCLCPIQGKVSGLGKGQSVCTFMQFSGAATWWVSGNCLDASQIVDGEWEQNWSSCGKANETGGIIIKAMILDKSYDAGVNIANSDLPQGISEAGRRIKRQ
jgi:hypothetical protein